ncbi:MAG: hypothetical protein ETSY1_09570 [Candidatus Entotheonella factor]|uniref:Alkyl hydroperoxide reductase subunit C/ Thiol specific antioxidant domain-containing protein n=1 Tax=Entotheonella factor TaxID=1429438 RepID=W4LSE3_ENTF1|nr:hypothetical protein [Candidatus Entotheonella palauensis]ETX00888.1 MAG: hypothetical protein ETSY1_09570 [Candidatus Entotheonella factor]
MQKAERDALITQMTPEERQDYFHLLQDWRARRTASADSSIRAKQLLEQMTETPAAAVHAALMATVERDEMGPRVGEVPPDFTLAQLGADDRMIQLSSFRGQKPVALVFGSYT